MSLGEGEIIMNGINKVHQEIFFHCQRLIKKTFGYENIVTMKYYPLPPPKLKSGIIISSDTLSPNLIAEYTDVPKRNTDLVIGIPI